MTLEQLLTRLARVEAELRAIRDEAGNSTHNSSPSSVADMQPLTSRQVAKMLGLSRSAIHNLDHVLAPRRSEMGVRIYDRATVERELERRKAGR